MAVTRFRATMMLCDHAQVADGKLFISGGGWSITRSPTPASALAVLLQVPWSGANRQVRFSLELRDSDGHPVPQRGPEGGTVPVRIDGGLEVGRPAGLPEGSPLDAPLAVKIAPLDLPPNRYVWSLTINGESHEDWNLTFLVTG